MRSAGVDPDELAGIVAAHPELFPEGSAANADDFRLALNTAATLASKEREVREISEGRKEEALYAAEEAYDNALDDDDLYELLNDFVEKVGPGDPRFQNFLAELTSGDDVDAHVARDWIEQYSANVAERRSEVEAEHAAAELVERTKRRDAQEKEALDTVSKFVKKHQKAIDRVGPRFGEMMQAIEITGNETREEIEKSLEMALHGAAEGKRLDAVSTFLSEFDAAAFAREPSYRDSEGDIRIPTTEGPAIDADAIQPKPSKAERQSAFDKAWDAHFSPSIERRDEADSAAARAVRYAVTDEAKSRRPTRGRKR
jgi:hypothetical protein